MDVDKVWEQYLSSEALHLSVPMWIVLGSATADVLQQKWQKHLASLPAMVLPTEQSKMRCSDFLQQAVGAGA